MNNSLPQLQTLTLFPNEACSMQTLDSVCPFNSCNCDGFYSLSVRL